MAKQHDSIRALAQTAEERLLLAQVAEKVEICQERNYPTCTKFLDLHETGLARKLLEAMGDRSGRFWGGHENAERQVLLFLPEWMEDIPTKGEDCPLAAIRCIRSKGDTLTHRDYLGSLMGLGLQRNGIGDILVGDHGADIIVLRELVPFLLTNYGKAGRKHLSVEQIPLSRVIIPQETVTWLRDTVASMRLDAVTAAMFRLSRAKAADAVRAGKVFVNQQECLRPDREVAVHDRITLRGMGRGEVDSILGESKKDRIVITMKRLG